jgi:hypothetical protein
MKLKAIGCAVACLVLTPGVLASSLENMDAVDYQILVITGETTNTVTIAAGQTIENICDNCFLQIVGDEDSVFDVYVNEAVAIRQGKFFLPDEEE